MVSNDATKTVVSSSFVSGITTVVVDNIEFDEIDGVRSGSAELPYLPVDPPPTLLGYFQLDNADITDWYQFLIKEADATTETFTIHGNATTNVMAGMEFRVFGTTNDGLYQALTVTYDPATNTTEIVVADIPNDENVGWIESYRDYGISLVLEDFIGVQVAEDANAALILTGGSLIDGFDYTYFDVGGMDEDVVTVHHLYGSSFV
jgi:hypothetical protein